MSPRALVCRRGSHLAARADGPGLGGTQGSQEESDGAGPLGRVGKQAERSPWRRPIRLLPGLGGPVEWKRSSGTPERDGTRMPDHPDHLLRELEVAEPGLKRLPLRRSAGSRARPKDSGVHQREPRLDLVRDWIARRIKPDAVTEWLRARFLPWLGGHTTRGTRAGQAFWSALEPDERARLWNLLEEFRAERRAERRLLDEREVAQIAVCVHRGLIAARQAWLGHANNKAK